MHGIGKERSVIVDITVFEKGSHMCAVHSENNSRYQTAPQMVVRKVIGFEEGVTSNRKHFRYICIP